MRTHSRADFRSVSDIASIAVPNSSAAATLIRSRILWTNRQPMDHQQYLRSKHDISWQDTEVSFSKNRYLQLKEKLCCTGNFKWTTYRRHPSPPVFNLFTPLPIILPVCALMFSIEWATGDSKQTRMDHRILKIVVATESFSFSFSPNTCTKTLSIKRPGGIQPSRYAFRSYL